MDQTIGLKKGGEKPWLVAKMRLKNSARCRVFGTVPSSNIFLHLSLNSLLTVYFNYGNDNTSIKEFSTSYRWGDIRDLHFCSFFAEICAYNLKSKIIMRARVGTKFKLIEKKVLLHQMLESLDDGKQFWRS